MKLSVLSLKHCGIVSLCLLLHAGMNAQVSPVQKSRERISINEGWQFMRYEGEGDSLIYDERPDVVDRNDNKVADTRATEERIAVSSNRALKKWILPSANDFISDPAKHHQRPEGDPGKDFPFVQLHFDDKKWKQVNLPHDWAIEGPFYKEEDAIVGGGMGRLPVQGIAWYRKKINIPANDKGRRIYLDIDGAMSYAMVWLNGKLVGGWPYGYNSFRLDLTPYVQYGASNQLAIRVDNPTNSARWYPGAGLYRNVWLVKTDPVHIAQWGSFITTRNISATAATIDIAIQVENRTNKHEKIGINTDVFLSGKNGKKIASTGLSVLTIQANTKSKGEASLTVNNPQLWGPPPAQKPAMYRAVTSLYKNGKLIDRYETAFGIRDVQFDPEKGIIVNGMPLRIQGVNQHHDLGALGAAFNVRAAERQLQLLQELGCNAIRLAHNPPAPELLNLTDRMGFLVIDEVHDCWEKGKTPLDFHLIFPEWYEADTRSYVRRDRNHPSVIAWSFGNEVGEQYTDHNGAAWAKKLQQIVKEEDPTRPTTASMNYAKPDMPFPPNMDIISLNYQGEGIRDAPAYAHLKGIRTSPLYPAFHQKFPGKLILSSETASALSSRGTYLFPVVDGNSAPVSEGIGGNGKLQQVSAYELYTAAFGASPDKVFASQDKHPYVAGEFVWSGWDYLGEPTPYYSARSSYSGIIDLAGFKKDRFYLYQSRWKPDFPMVHILPHWNWPERTGQVTPVHLFTSGDEAELFLNGRSLGKKKKGIFEYRLRWDDIVYEPGELKAIAYKNGTKWAEEIIRTTGNAVALNMKADRNKIIANGKDLSFITVSVNDEKGLAVPDASNLVCVDIEGPGEIIATDNGDPADLNAFVSKQRNLYSGLLLVVVQSKAGKPGTIILKANSSGVKSARLVIKSE